MGWIRVVDAEEQVVRMKITLLGLNSVKAEDVGWRVSFPPMLLAHDPYYKHYCVIINFSFLIKHRCPKEEMKYYMLNASIKARNNTYHICSLT